MILDSLDKHLTDQEFFTHIKFFNLMTGKNAVPNNQDTFSLYDLRLVKDESGGIFNRIYRTWKLLGVTATVDTEDYDFAGDFAKAKQEIEKKPESDKKSLNKIVANIEAGKEVKAESIAELSWVWYKIYDHLRFAPDDYSIKKVTEEAIQAEIDKYLQNFINDDLAIVTKNYYKFEKQKAVLINLIEEDKKISLYGNNFILREKIDRDGNVSRAPDFCIIQTVYALQKLGYLNVVNVWGDYDYKDKFGNEEIYFVNVNLILEEKFIAEINSLYKRENPKNTIEKFDPKTGVLKFAGKDIEISKKGKETDAVLLLTTLLKQKDDEWLFNDQILEDWGFQEDEVKEFSQKNKVYFAGLKIKQAVALKTQIDDLLEINTTKARINPKYKKIDE